MAGVASPSEEGRTIARTGTAKTSIVSVPEKLLLSQESSLPQIQARNLAITHIKRAIGAIKIIKGATQTLWQLLHRPSWCWCLLFKFGNLRKGCTICYADRYRPNIMEHFRTLCNIVATLISTPLLFGYMCHRSKKSRSLLHLGPSFWVES